MIDKKQSEMNLFAFICSNEKPLELYFFIDPLCPDCFALEPVIKKMQFEYGHYFSLTYVLSGNISNLNNINRKLIQPNQRNKYEKTIKRGQISCDDLEAKVNLSSPYIASIAVKAAELQGKRAGIRFLKKLQEYIYLKNENIGKLEILIQCAEEALLDVEEFMRDIHSTSTSHAFQCDLKITNEMAVTETPTIVFFNNKIEEEGLKLSGVNTYEIYIEVMTEILGERPVSHPLPPLLKFVQYNQFVSTRDIAFTYNLPHLQVELEMKKLLLQQQVERIHTSYGTFWKYVGQKKSF
ncbi:ClpXP adapter SpxH family protein [Pallidibacillus pasinlerensis]|nr:ClpXP adapter SpxH family protein [Pallidibacillus pasinlerensis]